LIEKGLFLTCFFLGKKEGASGLVATKAAFQSNEIVTQRRKSSTDWNH